MQGGEGGTDRTGERDAPDTRAQRKEKSNSITEFSRHDRVDGGRSPMKKVKLVISGDVQDVGFRLSLLKEAQRLSITNFFADNLPDKKTVIVLVGGKPKVVDEYVKIVRGMEKESNPRNIKVVDVERYEGDIREIRDFIDYLHTEQLIKGVEAVSSLGVTIGTSLKEVGLQFAVTVSEGFRRVDERLDDLPKKVADELGK